MKCLLVIDVQNGFVSERTEHIISVLNEKINEFNGELIIATKFINLPGSAYQSLLNWKRLTTTPEIELLDFVEKKCTYIIEKNVYTAWCKKLEEVLRKHNIKEVYITGIDTDCCVLKTAIDLFENDIKPIVIKDCCASNGGDESHKAAIKVLERTIGREQIL